MTSTHPFVRKLILITCWFSIGCLLIQGLFDIPSYQLFTLNTRLVSNFYFWQPITALFYVPADTLSFGFILDLAFSMLVLSTLGSHVVDVLGKKHFLTLYVGATLVACFAALLAFGV